MMKLPSGMVVPTFTADRDEQVLFSVHGLRRKGIFGNRYGSLVVTSKRVVFQKAIMNAGLANRALSRAVSPVFALQRAELSGTVVQTKGQVKVVFAARGVTETVVVSPDAAAQITALLQASA